MTTHTITSLDKDPEIRAVRRPGEAETKRWVWGYYVDSEGDPIRRQPDAQFQDKDTAYPGVVVEVSYSQDGKDLAKLAQDYILYSNGDIKAVIGLDINYGGRESTVSLWRPKYPHKENQDLEDLESRQDIARKVRHSFSGRYIAEEACVKFNMHQGSFQNILQIKDGGRLGKAVTAGVPFHCTYGYNIMYYRTKRRN